MTQTFTYPIDRDNHAELPVINVGTLEDLLADHDEPIFVGRFSSQKAMMKTIARILITIPEAYLEDDTHSSVSTQQVWPTDLCLGNDILLSFCETHPFPGTTDGWTVLVQPKFKERVSCLL